MIISKIIGGLGNQMFQYAAGRALSLEYGVPLRLDVFGFADYSLHQGFELQQVFNCPAETAAESDVRSILGWQFSSGIRRIVARPGMAPFRREAFVVEPHFHYWPEINRVPQECYLHGYWQSEKYFQSHASDIRADFTFKHPLSISNAELAEHIAQVNAISLHVRRGDYASNPKTTATHRLCTLDYYHEAIQYICERIERPNFFIFSDDMAWVKEHLKIDSLCQHIDHNFGTENYNDMRLMSLCKHHIIANSSFSWWGAWLNPSAGKIVIAPKQWFANETNTQDLIPDEWLII